MNSADFKKTAAPHPDGFGGARDAAILGAYDREGDFVMVQGMARTKDLLKRAGVKRVKTHAFYKVPVARTLAGLQLNGNAA
jgi:hypothetical protein